MFTVEKKSKKNRARLGKLSTMHGKITTPCFMPIATKAAVKNLTPAEIKELGAEIILSNTYHLWQRPGLEIIKKAGGLHRFMGWFDPILTDSGGYQIFSLARMRKITGGGVKFRSEIDGRDIFLTPEKSIKIQLALGSDIIMVLDECPPWPCSLDYAEKSLKLTLDWAQRCKKYFVKKTHDSKLKIPAIADPLLFGIVQGSTYKNLRQEGARKLVEIGFDGYAVGGVSVGEPHKEKIKVLNWAAPLLPEDKPRYLMGLGRPEEIVEAVGLGVDMFDCVIPTREARHGRLYKFSIFNFQFSNKKGKKFYDTFQITNAEFRKDFKPIDKNCECYSCRNFSRAYLRHLFMQNEPLGMRLATIHNLKFYLELMKKIRTSI